MHLGATVPLAVLARPAALRPPPLLLALLVPGLMLTACAGTGPAPTGSSPAPASSTTSTTARTDWPTYHGDLARTGVSTAMPAVTTEPTVAAALNLDAAVYASPIVVGGVTVVATENDSVYGIDAEGRQLWRTSLGAPVRLSDLPCGNIDPLGITGTPVFDATTGLVYAVAEHGPPVTHELVALDPADGRVAWRTGVDLPGVDPTAMQQRGALTITGGTAWIPFGGLAGDCGAYKGRVVGVPLAEPHVPSAYTVPTTREAGIWTPPGPSVDGQGRLFVAVGNGESGTGDPYDSSDSVLELDGTTLVDSFSPDSWRTDNEADLDLGSQGPALVGDRWVFAAGKKGTAYVLRRGHLGGIGGQVSSLDLCTSFGGTAVAGDVVYVPCTDGLRAVRIRDDGTMEVLWHADSAVTGSPVVGGGRLWSLQPDAGVLHALDPGTGGTLSRTPVGVTSRFATPALSGRDVIVPTMAGITIVRTG
jgi:hypothetical protein